MVTLTKDELNKILENHRHWLNEDCDGWENMQADLRGAYLRGADLERADLRGAVNIPFIPLACPDTGSFTAWKKASGKIVKLLVPEDAQRSSATTRKCRCSKAIVLEIQNIDGTLTEDEQVASDRDRKFIYKAGETVEVEDFNTDRWNECSTGIHFFVNRQEAVEY